MGGMRPIVEIMTVNFSLLALDQILNNAATLLHMSGGQLGVPLVIRMTTGAGRQLAAQHSHSLEGWYAHIPGLRVLAPATLEDARGMLWPALADPDPVLIFEHGSLYNMQGELPADAGPVDIDHGRDPPAGHRHHADHLRRHARQDAGRRRRAGRRRASTPRSSTCARCDRWTTRPSWIGAAGPIARSIVDEGWRSGSLVRRDQRPDHGAGVLRTRRAGRAGLHAPRCRCLTPQHLEEAALPQVAGIVAAARAGGGLRWPSSGCPSLGADMDEGTVLEWLVKPGRPVHKGDIVAVVDTAKAAIEVESFDSGVVERARRGPGETVPVGTALARRSAGTARPASRPQPCRRPQPPRRRAPAADGSSPPIRHRAR